MAEALDVPRRRPARELNLHEKIRDLSYQYEALEASLLEIEKQKAEIQCQLEILKDDMPDPGEKIIAFVEELDKAREYLSFTGYLRGRHDIWHDSDEILTFKRLVQHERVHERFTKLYFEDIMNAVQDHILDLQMSQMFGEYLETCGDQIRRTPIFNLVYRVLEEEKIVVVRNVPITYQEIELQAIFSDCGDIESVTFERDGEWHQIA